jgi:tetratricopeptide (TPR) repeat protein
MYYYWLSGIAFHSWNIDESYSYAEKAMQIDSTNYWFGYFACLHRTGNYKRLYVDFLKPYESDFYSGDLKDLHPYLNETFAIHLGMYYWYKGDTTKAKNLLQIEIERINQDFIGHDFLGTGVRDALQHWIELFSVIGDIDYAFHLFRQFQDISSNFDVYRQGYYISFKMSPRFANISQESWFQDAIHEWESELETEHERVRLWLEENDML